MKIDFDVLFISALTDLQKIHKGIPLTKAAEEISINTTVTSTALVPEQSSKTDPTNVDEIDHYEFQLSDDYVTDTEQDDHRDELNVSKSRAKQPKCEKLSCDICGKVLSSKGNLKKHQVPML